VEKPVSANTFEVTETNFQNEVLQSQQPVLVDFWAEWCSPCKMIEPLVDQIAEQYADKLRVGKLDSDSNYEVVTRYNVMSIPTLILFKGGQPVERVTGYQPKERIVAKLAPHLA
jgi:thioredoxin 1